MAKKFICIILCAAFAHSVAAQDTSFSSKNYENCDHQKVFNAVKTIFLADKDNEYIIDTSWDRLQVVKRESLISLFYADIAQTVYTFDANVTADATKLQLQIYTQRSDKKKVYIDSKSITHQLFWNRIGYVLGKDQWMQCSGLQNSQSFLCTLDKESIKP